MRVTIEGDWETPHLHRAREASVDKHCTRRCSEQLHLKLHRHPPCTQAPRPESCVCPPPKDPTPQAPCPLRPVSPQEPRVPSIPVPRPPSPRSSPHQQPPAASELGAAGRRDSGTALATGCQGTPRPGEQVYPPGPHLGSGNKVQRQREKEDPGRAGSKGGHRL